MRSWKTFIFCLIVLAALCGCSAEKNTQPERRQVEFAVLAAEEIPKELQEVLEKQKARAMRMTYQDQENLYLIRGYGEQETGGYRILVTECSEDDENLYFSTQLQGPENAGEAEKSPSYPYLVAKIEFREKQIRLDE